MLGIERRHFGDRM